MLAFGKHNLRLCWGLRLFFGGILPLLGAFGHVQGLSAQFRGLLPSFGAFSLVLGPLAQCWGLVPSLEAFGPRGG